MLFSRLNLGAATVLLTVLLQCGIAWGAPPAPFPPAAAEAGAAPNPLTPLGPGDSVALHVFGQPDMDSVLGVADDGSIRVPLVGAVQVGGTSTEAAARRIEKLFRDGGYFVDPHVSLTLTQSLSQRVSVLGEVKTPGRYPVDSKTSIVDLLAEAGGETELGSDTIFILRADASGQVQRQPVSLRGLGRTGTAAPTQLLRAGDSLFVPRAEQFYILGEVQKPGMYKIEDNLTVLQAISVAGGVTLKGSQRRVEIKRTDKGGQQVTTKGKPNDLVQPNDVIRVKESIF